MKHSVAELINITHRYYPRGLAYDDYRETEEYRRLVAARRQAGAECEFWRALLSRICEKYPGKYVQNASLHLPTGAADAGYSGALFLPTSAGEHFHTVGFLISFIVPYYVIYSSRTIDDIEAMASRRASKVRTANVFVEDTCYALPTGMVGPVVAAKDNGQPRRSVTSFVSSPDEQPYADWIALEIEATFGYQRMPAEIGNVIVPNVATNLRAMGEATLYDCLFADDWHFDR